MHLKSNQPLRCISTLATFIVVLSEEIFNNIICILRLSIDIVSYYDIYALDVPWYQEMIDNNIGKDRVSEFDIYKCLCVIGRLQKNSKKSKIIYLN